MSKKWYEKGVQFKCQGSGNCCVSRGQYGYVYLTKEDRKLMAKELDINTSTFTRTYCHESDGSYYLKEAYLPDGSRDPSCRFLKNNKCGVYKARPTQCRTWPFWPDNMKSKVWSKEVKNFCPGIGKGRIWPLKEIEKNLKEEAAAEEILFG